MPSDDVLSFYDGLAGHYHLIYADWPSAVERQGRVLDRVIVKQLRGQGPWRVLDCACGIGTQALGLAMRGHRVTASDLSPGSVARLRHEAESRGLEIQSHVTDFTDLSPIPGDFDVVMALDNALPHLSSETLVSKALKEICAKLVPGGLVLVSLRPYDKILERRPKGEGPVVRGQGEDRRIIQQIWDWQDERCYDVHLIIKRQFGGNWQRYHHRSRYRAIRSAECLELMRGAGFDDPFLMEDCGFHQPIFAGRKLP